MTAEHQACEEHILTHTKPSSQTADLWLDDQPKWNLINWELFDSLQSEDYMQLNAGWNETQNSRSSTTTSSQEHYPAANHRLHSEYKTQGASHNSIHI